MTETLPETLDETASLGPKLHIGCCETDRPMSFCGREPDPAKTTIHPHGSASTCVPCVEADESRKDFCPRHGTCPRGGRR